MGDEKETNTIDVQSIIEKELHAVDSGEDNAGAGADGKPEKGTEGAAKKPEGEGTNGKPAGEGKEKEEGADDADSKKEDDEEVEVKGVGKMKIKDIKSAIETHKKSENWTQKFQDLSAKEKEVEALRGFGNMLKSRPGLMQDFLKLLVSKKEGDTAGGNGAGASDIEQTKEEIAELFGELDVENDPYAKAMKKLYDKVMGISTQLQKASNVVSEKFGREEEETATKTLRSALESVRKELKLEGAENDQVFQLVRKFTYANLVNEKTDYANLEEFAEATKNIAREIHAAIEKFGEAKLAGYIKGKKAPTPPGAGTGGAGEKTTAVEFKGDNLQDYLEAELKAKKQEREAAA